MDEVRFWAGGSAPGWFVKLSRPQEVYPGKKPADVIVMWFNSMDYPNGETGAARAADALSARLNAALEV